MDRAQELYVARKYPPFPTATNTSANISSSPAPRQRNRGQLNAANVGVTRARVRSPVLNRPPTPMPVQRAENLDITIGRERHPFAPVPSSVLNALQPRPARLSAPVATSPVRAGQIQLAPMVHLAMNFTNANAATAAAANRPIQIHQDPFNPFAQPQPRETAVEPLQGVSTLHNQAQSSLARVTLPTLQLGPRLTAALNQTAPTATTANTPRHGRTELDEFDDDNKENITPVSSRTPVPTDDEDFVFETPIRERVQQAAAALALARAARADLEFRAEAAADADVSETQSSDTESSSEPDENGQDDDDEDQDDNDEDGNGNDDENNGDHDDNNGNDDKSGHDGNDGNGDGAESDLLQARDPYLDGEVFTTEPEVPVSHGPFSIHNVH
jgi:hypothetical protein